MRGESATTRYRPFVCEDEVGITEFSTPDLGGVGGRLKLLPPDFIVEELHQPQQPQQHSSTYVCPIIRPCFNLVFTKKRRIFDTFD